MIRKKYLLNVLEKLTKVIITFVIYSSVLVGILFPMLIVGGFFVFLRQFYWISWFFADPTTYFKDLVTCWLNTSLDIHFFYSVHWVVFKIIVFVMGILFFIISLAYLVIGIKKKVGLVQSRIYKRVRHPQNLAIIIMAFPLFLYSGFRMGDFVSWIQFIFIMIIYCDIGDIKLKRKFPEEFQLYYENSGFFFPRILPYRISYYFSAIYNKRYRYPLLLLIYICCIIILYQLYIVLPFIPLVI